MPSPICRILGVLMALALLSAYGAAQKSDISVKIINSPPQVKDVWASSVPAPAASSIVWCTAACEDLNSYKDLISPAAYIGMPDGEGIRDRKDADLISFGQESVIRGRVLAGFVIGSDTKQGPWECVIESKDTIGDAGKGRAEFKVMPGFCGNGKQDPSETGMDCGGPCMPCTCINGAPDEGETGSDCGGPCGLCEPEGKLSITVPKQAFVGDVISAQVKAGNKGMRSLVRVERPDGKLHVFSTDDSGVVNIGAELSGNWGISADLLGYAPATVAVEVKAPLTNYIIGALAIVVVLLVFVLLLKRRKGGKPPTRSSLEGN